MDIKSTLFSLSNLAGIGSITDASDFAFNTLSEYADTKRLAGLGVLGEIKGESNYTILIDAHIDEVGFIVTHISDDGFLTVQKCGGIDLRHLPSKVVTIHSEEKLTGVFVSTPAHLAKDDTVPDDITDIKIDTLLGAKAKEKIKVGDFVTFKANADTLKDTICVGKAFDNRAGVCALLELAKRLSTKKLPVTVKFLLSDGEELGLRGAKTAAYSTDIDESIVIDVSFGNGPDISEFECGKVSLGGMIGISPVLSKSISNKLLAIANNNKIKYQTEVMGGRTSTNADVISLNKDGVSTGLISIPLRNMHTDCEILDIADINSVCDILENYILLGGVKND